MKKNFLLIFILASIVSCKKDDRTPTPATGIKTGSIWVYKYTSFNETGSVTGTSNITATISSEQTIAGEQWWVLTAGSNASPFKKGAAGYYDYRNSTSQLHYKIPAAVNDTWRFTYSNSVGDYDDYTVMAINENVTVPMGTIACYAVELHDSNSLENKEWYNEANALVKQFSYDETSGGVTYMNSSLELVSFTP